MALKIQAEPDRQQYYLVAGEIVFQMKEDEPPNAIRLNSVLATKEGQIRVSHIGRAQQSLQLQFHKMMEDPTIKVLNVVILAISSLGFFTEEEFNAPPPGSVLRQMETAGHG